MGCRDARLSAVRAWLDVCAALPVSAALPDVRRTLGSQPTGTAQL